MASYQYVYHMDGVSKTYPGGKKCFEMLNSKNCFLDSYNNFMQGNEQKYNFISRFKRGGISFVQYKGKHDKNISVIDFESQHVSNSHVFSLKIGVTRASC